LLPCSLSLIVQHFPDRRERARALGVWGGIASIGMATGPVVGGTLIAFGDWRSIFLVNVPFCAITWVTIYIWVDEGVKFREKRIDTPGLIAGAVALFAVTGGLIEAGQLGWRRPIPLALLVGGLLVGAVFLIVEWRQREPMLPLRLFRSRGFSAATAAGGIFNFCLYGALLCVSLFVQGPLGRPALESGLILLPLTVAVGIGAFLSGRLTAQFGPRVPMVIGYSAGAVGAALLILAGTSLFLVVLGSATLGFCSIAMPAMTSVVMSAAEPARTGLASGVLNTARQTGGALVLQP
jgi:DHA2 family methylenomycin A resistance protein-like MFS transporter